MTASHFTPRLALPYPDEGDPADVPLDIANLANKLDGLTARAPGAVTSAAPLLDVGVLNQIRAGRQLTLADFTALGLSAPVALWNLSDLTDASGNARTLVNKGAVPFAPGINGGASTAASFAGSTAQALYISDTGAADPFRIKTGSWGCWVRTAKRATEQMLVVKDSLVGTNRGWLSRIQATGGVVNALVSASDGNSIAMEVSGVTDLTDDRWHFFVATFDGSGLRVYIDAVLEASISSGGGPAFGSSAPLNLGSRGADGATAGGGQFYGRMDEAFVTADVLSPDQVRGLYCAKLAHGLSYTPSIATLGVRRRRKGGPLAVADFPTQPLRLHNFTAGSLGDEGSGNVALVNNGAALSVSGADGAAGGAFGFVTASSQSLSSTDAGLPAGTAARSYGAWFKTGTGNATLVFIAYGAAGGSGMFTAGAGELRSTSGADEIVGPFAADGQWHFAVTTENNEAGDGVKRKMYLDGRLVGNSTVLNAITLGGANYFRIGAGATGINFFNGQADGAFVCGYALTAEQIATLYAKGSQALSPSPKNVGDHVEFMDATNVYVAFDSLETQNTIDLAVTG
jgi:hypothetical protein